jgi:UDP-N-acetylglucosamine--N-acetylmuramyl-(pentapeptide) pyrophosphoryl-undecaprenol N-acetylglucosamine transferase
MRTTSTSTRLQVVIGAGGTGGHIYPGLAVAAALREITDDQTDIHFFGARGRLETRLVPDAGYPLHTTDITGLSGVSGLSVPWRLARAAAQSARRLRELHTDVVIGMGGYPSVPAVVGAWLIGVPRLIHESNAMPGRANLFASRLTPHIAVAFDEAHARFAPGTDVRTVGMPLLPEVAAMDRAALRGEARAAFGVAGDQQLVVISGGSLGARSITRSAVELARRWRGRDDVRLVIKTGPHDLPEAQRMLAGNPCARAVAYLDRMDLAYAAADVVVTRAGAATVSEISHLGVASILVPYPHAPGDHQRHNAESLVHKGAAIMIDDTQLSGSTLQTALESLLGNPGRRARMANAARNRGHQDAAHTVARWACQLAGYPVASTAARKTRVSA